MTVKNMRLFSVSILLVAALMLSACNAPSVPQTPTLDTSSVLTQAAGTAIVRLTETAAMMPTATATVTEAPTITPLPATPTSAVTTAATQQPTVGLPTNTTAPVVQATTSDAASFVSDVNYPDNTVVTAGETIEKKWMIKNTGPTTWTTNYSIVAIDLGNFTGPESVAMPVEVKSGETVEITVRLTAPTTNGTHKAYYRLRNANGQFFHLDGSGDLWVQVVVGAATTTPTAESEAPEATATSESASGSTGP